MIIIIELLISLDFNIKCQPTVITQTSTAIVISTSQTSFTYISTTTSIISTLPTITTSTNSPITNTLETTTTTISNTTNSQITTTTVSVSYSSITNQMTTSPIVLKKSYRLPKNLKPYYYELTIASLFEILTEPDTFDGVVKIYFTCIVSTDYIVLHKKSNIDIDEEKIIIKDVLSNESFNLMHFVYDDETEIMKLHLTTYLENNKNYSLSMHYLGHHEANNYGFYKSFYNDADENKRWLVTSQMEPTEARSAFPCFDEPEMKSTFKLSVIHNQGLTAMSNMPGKLSFL